MGASTFRLPFLFISAAALSVAVCSGLEASEMGGVEPRIVTSPVPPVAGQPPYDSSGDRGDGVEPIREFTEPAGPVDPRIYGKVAVVQWASKAATPIGVSRDEAEYFKRMNRQALEGYAREAAARGAKMVITPEFAIVGYPDIPDVPAESDQFRDRDDLRPYTETVPGPSTEHFSAVARELGIYLHIGIAEVDPVTDLFYNTVVALGPDGAILAKYRKMSLYGSESNFLQAGREPVTYRSIFGVIGLAICSDIYHASPMNDYRDSGVRAIALSTSWAAWNGGIRAYQGGAGRARAYVLAANQNYFPDSGVVNPDGSRQSHIRQSDGVAYGYLPYDPAPARAD